MRQAQLHCKWTNSFKFPQVTFTTTMSNWHNFGTNSLSWDASCTLWAYCSYSNPRADGQLAWAVKWSWVCSYISIWIVIIHSHQLGKSRMKSLIMTTCIILLPSSTRGDQGSNASQELLKDVLAEKMGKGPCKGAGIVVHVMNLDILSQPVLTYESKQFLSLWLRLAYSTYYLEK